MHAIIAPTTTHYKKITHRALIALEYLVFTVASGWYIDLRFEYVTVH